MLLLIDIHEEISHLNCQSPFMTVIITAAGSFRDMSIELQLVLVMKVKWLLHLVKAYDNLVLSSVNIYIPVVD